MNEPIIELRLSDERDAVGQETFQNSPCEMASFAARLLGLISETTVESDTLDTPGFRKKLEKFRSRLETSADGDPETAIIANECLLFCESYLGRGRQYLLEREQEFAEVIDVMRVAIGKLAGDAKTFNVRLIGSSERLNRLTEIEDIRELKKRINQEVHDLNRVVTEKQKQDELNYARLSKRIEVLQANLTHSKEEASIDPLTRVSNRGCFDRAFAEWVTTHKDSQKPFVLGMLDLDNFKQINDKHGHQVGDRVLFCAAQWLLKSVRPDDFIARYGGEEFVVLLTDVELSQAEAKFAELLGKMSRCSYAFNNGDEECTVTFTASCGLAEFTLDESGEDLLRRADEALYVAKKAGKNRVVLAKTPKSLWKALTLRGLPRMTKQRT